MMRRSHAWQTVSGGSSSGGCAGFAPAAVASCVRVCARLDRPLRPAAVSLLISALACLAVGCGGPAPHPPAAALRSVPPTAGDDVVIEDHRAGAVPLAARRVGERFLVGYVAYLYGRERAGGLDGTTRSLARELRRVRVRVPPARAARTPRIVSLRSAQQLPATVWSPRSSMTAISLPTPSPRASSDAQGAGRSPDWLTIDLPWRSPLRNVSASAQFLPVLLRRLP